MAQTYAGSAMHIVNNGFSAATGAASARTAIPVDASGNRPKYIRVSARNECYVRVGDSTVVATTDSILVQPADSLILLVTTGHTHIAYIQGTAAGQVNVVPLENQ